MEDLIWLVQIDGIETKTLIKIKTIAKISLSSKANLGLTTNSLILIAYTVLALLTKRSLPLAAFFMSAILLELSFFDVVKEYQLYLMTFAIYSYVITRDYMQFKQKIACGIILILSIVFSYDAALYGAGGYLGAHKTIVWHSIPSLSICAHILFITSFINTARINNSIRLFIASVVRFSRNSACIVLI